MTWARPNVSIEFLASDIDRLATSTGVPIPLDGHALADAVADMAERLRRIEIMRQALATADSIVVAEYEAIAGQEDSQQ